MLDFYPAILAAIIATASPTNKAPVSIAGDDIRASEGTHIALSGLNSSDDKQIVHYQWKENNIILSENANFSHFFSPGTHHITLKVSDIEGESDVSHMSIKMLTQKMMDDEANIYGKNFERLQTRATLLSTLESKQNTARQNAPQRYSEQQNQAPKISFALENIIPLNPTAITSVAVKVLDTNPIPLARHETFTLHNISLEIRGDSVYLVNKTGRLLSALSGSYIQANGDEIFNLLKFDTIIEPFTEYKLEHFEHDAIMSIVETAPLYDANMAFKLNLNPKYSDNEWTYPTEIEKNTYHTLMANTKYFSNSIHLYRIFNAMLDSEAYLGVDFSWLQLEKYTEMAAYGNDYEYGYKHVFHYAKPMNTYRLEYQTLQGIEIMAGGAAYLGSPDGKMSMVSLLHFELFAFDEVYTHTKNAYPTFIHETMHAYGYTHESGMTDGFPEMTGLIEYYLYGNDQQIEALPGYIFKTKELGPDKYQVTVFKTGDSNETYFEVGLYSNAMLSATITKTAREDTFIVETAPGYSPEYILRVSSFDSEQVMSKIIQ